MDSISISATLPSIGGNTVAPGAKPPCQTAPEKGTPDFAQTVSDAVAEAKAQSHTSTDTSTSPANGSPKTTGTSKTHTEPRSKPAGHMETAQTNSLAYAITVSPAPTPERAPSIANTTNQSQNPVGIKGTDSTTSPVDAGTQAPAGASVAGPQSAADGPNQSGSISADAATTDLAAPVPLETVPETVLTPNSDPNSFSTKESSTALQAAATPSETNVSETEAGDETQNGTLQHNGSSGNSTQRSNNAAGDSSAAIPPNATQAGNQRAVANISSPPSGISGQQVFSKSSASDTTGTVPSRPKVGDASKNAATNANGNAPQTNSRTSSPLPANVDSSQTASLDMRQPDPAAISLSWHLPSETAKTSTSSAMDSTTQDSRSGANQQSDKSSTGGDGGNPSADSMPSPSNTSTERRNAPSFATADSANRVESNSAPVAETSSAVSMTASAATMTTAGRDSAAASQPEAQASALPSSAQLRSSELPETQFVNMSSLLEGMMHGEMHLSMQTERLGTVELRTRVSGDQVGATIAVEKHDTQALLSNALPQLHQALSDKNLFLEHVNIQHGLFGAAAQNSTAQSKQDSGSRHSGSSSTRTTGSSVSSTAIKDEAGIYDLRGRLSVRA
jgi:flagellar hook-length control protein FliK